MSWKENISSYGKELEVEIIIDDKTYTAKDVVSLNPHYDGALYKSVMKAVDVEFDGKYDFKGKTITSIRVGVRVGSGEYDYIGLGSFIVKECEYDVATNSTKCECYDKMLSSMVSYDIQLDYSVTVTVKDLLLAICERFNWTFSEQQFTNSEVVIDEEKFNSEYTFRDVLDQIAEVAGGIIAFKPDGNIYVLYPTESNETIDESNLKSLTIGEKYGPVNSLVLSRTPQEDNIYKQDEDSIAENGLCEVKIENNQIMDSHRDDFIDALFERVKGTEYYLYNLESFGIGYLNLCDLFTIQTVDGTEYKTLFLRDDMQITQGINEKSYLEAPEKGATDYSAADKTERKINQTMLKVDKQAQEITALISRTESTESGIESLTKSVEATMTEENVKIAIKEAIDGVDGVKTSTGYTFDKDGLHIEKDGSNISTTIDDDGMSVANENEEVLTANHEGVNAMNLTSRQYLIVGDNSRFENYETDTDYRRTGCFFIGG
ncbi:MAG: hypothetical protein ACI4IK_02895 [Eubacterium sp.]